MLNHSQVVRPIVGWKLRQAGGLGPDEMARLSYMSVRYLNKVEKGKTYPKGDKILGSSAAAPTASVRRRAWQVAFEAAVTKLVQSNS